MLCRGQHYSQRFPGLRLCLNDLRNNPSYTSLFVLPRRVLSIHLVASLLGFRYLGESRVPEGICPARVWRKLPRASRRHDRRDRPRQPLHSPFLDACFREGASAVEICKKFLSAAASAYNKKAPLATGSRNMRSRFGTGISCPSLSTHYGSLTDRFIFEINTGRALRERNSKIARSQTPCHRGAMP